MNLMFHGYYIIALTTTLSRFATVVVRSELLSRYFLIALLET